MRRDCWGFFPRKYRLVSLATWFKRRRGKIPQSLKILNNRGAPLVTGFTKAL
jgi:hypothetical protein